MEQISMPLDDPWAGYQPRYVAYCRAHLAPSPEAMLARDRVVWAGGCTMGYSRWITRAWRKWCRLVGHRGDRYTTEDHAAFDAHLAGIR